MVKKKVLVLGLAVALLVGSGSVYASALPVGEVITDSVIASEVGVPTDIIGNPAFEIPADVDITGDLLRSHFTIVDAEGNDLGLKDKLRFLTGKGGLMTPEAQATILTNAFKEDVKSVVSIIALVDGYPSLNCETNVLLGQIINEPFNISYATHVQNEGWQKEVKDGKMSGTEGKSLRLEGITIDSGLDGVGVEYTTHVQNIGWQDYVADGKMSGTEGLSYRLEAIKIRLTGENADQYDVYYRVHAQNVGWMGWASNDAPSGTAGYSYRLEGIEIKVVDKGTVIDVGGEAFKDASTQSTGEEHTLVYYSAYYKSAVAISRKVIDGQVTVPRSGPGWVGGTFKHWTVNTETYEAFDFSQPIKQSYEFLPVYEDANGQLVCPPITGAEPIK